MVNGVAGVPIVHAVDHVVVVGEQGIVCVTIQRQAVVVGHVLVPMYIDKFVLPSLVEEVRSFFFGFTFLVSMKLTLHFILSLSQISFLNTYLQPSRQLLVQS